MLLLLCPRDGGGQGQRRSGVKHLNAVDAGGATPSVAPMRRRRRARLVSIAPGAISLVVTTRYTLASSALGSLPLGDSDGARLLSHGVSLYLVNHLVDG